jgi:protein TonB
VQFKVDKNGNVTNIVARGPHPGLEKEAKRVIGQLPKMKPGKQRGKAVVMPFSIPIVFQVQD